MNLLTIKDMSKSYTDKVLFDHVDFSINENEKIGVIGINGTGKSTLLKIAAGLSEPDSGSVVKGSNVHIRYLSQNPDFTPGSTIYEYVIKANTTQDNQWSIEGEAKTILNKLGFSEYDTVVDRLSGGEKKRVALAGALLARADILILDEPTNHLDRWMTNWLEKYLTSYKGAILMVTHDRYFLDRVSSRILEIDRGSVYSYETNYEGFLELKAQREEMADSSEQKRRNILRRELEWIKRGAKARSTKQKARIDRYNELKDAVPLKKNESAQLSSVYTRMGKKTIELHNVSKSYEGKLLINDFSYIFLRNEAVAFVGKNGCGKSTLMRLITGQEKPDSGEVEMGDTIRIGYFAQENEELNPNQRVIDCIKDVAEYVKTADGSISASVMLERFLFDAALQYSLIGKLSGGEKRRLYLIKVLMAAPNVLILDEPTNDLDIQTLSILEDYLEEFDGIIIIVSHDRYFLDRTADRIFVFGDGGRITEEVHKDTDSILEDTAGKGAGAANAGKGAASAGDNGGKNGKAVWNKGERALKLSYQEQKEYDTIEDDIAELEDRIAELDEEMAGCATDFVKLNELGRQKEEIQKLLDGKYVRWEYLTELAEKIKNNRM